MIVQYEHYTSSIYRYYNSPPPITELDPQVKKIKIVNLFIPFFHPGISHGRCSGTLLTGNHCIAVPVIRGDATEHLLE